VNLMKVKAHSDDYFNDFDDRLANEERTVLPHSYISHLGIPDQNCTLWFNNSIIIGEIYEKLLKDCKLQTL
ncbi:4740_t:CDS:1, partial [Rhizophagus irregularis]